jgi:hypothetical protein
VRVEVGGAKIKRAGAQLNDEGRVSGESMVLPSRSSARQRVEVGEWQIDQLRVTALHAHVALHLRHQSQGLVIPDRDVGTVSAYERARRPRFRLGPWPAPGVMHVARLPNGPPAGPEVAIEVHSARVLARTCS